MSKQQKIEKKVFEAFCDVCELSIIKDSIENKNPPEPDILCKVNKTNFIAIELTEIVDRTLANNFNKQIESMNILRNYYLNLSEDLKERFKNKYNNAMIWPQFKEKCTMLQRKKLLPHIFECLLSIDNNFEGMVLKDNHKYSDKYENIKISRGKFEGPLFDSPCSTLFTDPTFTTISTKFNKRYKSDHPIHLLGYYNQLFTTPKNILIPTIVNLCEESLLKSEFTKIWIFDYPKRKIVYTYP